MKYTQLVIVGGLIVGGALVVWRFWPNHGVSTDMAHAASTNQLADVVTFSSSKLQSAGIRVGTAEQTQLQATRTIPGRLDYDQDRHVVLKAASEGVITELHVRPGDAVSRGQIVAVVNSPDVGRARADVLARQADVDLAITQLKWQQDILHGVEELVAMIRAGRPLDEIERQLEKRSLGDYRETLVAAYTRIRLAKSVVENSRQAASRGAIPSQLQQRRESELDSAEATVAAAAEQSLFEVRQRAQAAVAKRSDAERQLEISLQELNALLGPAAKQATVESIQRGGPMAAVEVQLVSPINGTVEERWLAESERVMAGDALYTIADTSYLWAVADVRERDWEAMTVDVGQDVSVSTPAIPNRLFDGKIFIVGRSVNPVTGAAHLIARLQTGDARLRPGMFIHMSVPFGRSRDMLLVPESAVVVHEGQTFVFMPLSDSEFRRVDVTTGITEGALIEITDGLRPGDKVVIDGTFNLKSELLLAKDAT